jgi:hypothetical protein
MEKKQTTRGIVRDERTTLNAQLRLLVSPMHQLGAQRGSLRSFSGKVLRSSKDVGGDEYNLRAHQQHLLIDSALLLQIYRSRAAAHHLTYIELHQGATAAAVQV